MGKKTGWWKFHDAVQEITKVERDSRLSSYIRTIIQKLKKVDPKLLEKAGMSKYKIFNSINTLLANANTKTIMKVRKALGCMSQGVRVGF